MKHTQSDLLSEDLLQQSQYIGACFARLRLARQVKQEVAAVRAGISRNTAYRLEKGDPGVAMGQLLRYLEAIAPGMTLHSLLEQKDPSLSLLAAKEKTYRVRDLSSQERSDLDF